MKTKFTTLLLLFSLMLLSNIVPQTALAQSPSQIQLDKVKKDYQEGKITLEEYQKQSNALLQYNAPIYSTTTPGDHFTSGGRCLVAGSTFMIVGGALAGTSVLWGDNSAFIITAIGGGAMAFVGLIVNMAGGAQFIKAGKKMNALKIGQQTSAVQFHPSSEGVGFAMKF